MKCARVRDGGPLVARGALGGVGPLGPLPVPLREPLPHPKRPRAPPLAPSQGTRNRPGRTRRRRTRRTRAARVCGAERAERGALLPCDPRGGSEGREGWRGLARAGRAAGDAEGEADRRPPLVVVSFMVTKRPPWRSPRSRLWSRPGTMPVGRRAPAVSAARSAEAAGERPLGGAKREPRTGSERGPIEEAENRARRPALAFGLGRRGSGAGPLRLSPKAASDGRDDQPVCGRS